MPKTLIMNDTRPDGAGGYHLKGQTYTLPDQLADYYLGIGLARYPSLQQRQVVADRDPATGAISTVGTGRDPIGAPVTAVTRPGGGVRLELPDSRNVSGVLMSGVQFAPTPNSLITAETPTLMFRFAVRPDEQVTVSRIGGNRFRIVEMASVVTAYPQVVDRVVINSDSSTNHTFTTGKNAVEVWVYVGFGVGVNGGATLQYVYESLTADGPLLVDVARRVLARTPRFRLEMSAIPDVTARMPNAGPLRYPRLAAVHMNNLLANTHPYPEGYLYTTAAPHKFLYARGAPEDMEFLADWNMGITWGGDKTPSRYASFVAKNGDIICVARGDLIGDGPINPAARQNAIVYPAGDYANPVVVDFGGGIKPTAWGRHIGIAEMPTGGTILFAEYTRTCHEKMYIWKVVPPYSNPANWTRMMELTVDRTAGNGPIGLKHFHAMNYDPWSGALVATTGDDDNGAKIFVSTNQGETWDLHAEGSEKHCRLSHVVFMPDGAYWATDSGANGKHFLLRAPRAAGVPDFSIPAQQELYEFPYVAGAQATYNTILTRDPAGLLFLDRQDASQTAPVTMKVYFWSFEHSEMFVAAELQGASNLGFRVDAVNVYPPRDGNWIVCGWNEAFAQNVLYTLGNGSMPNRLNNMKLRVVDES